MLVFNSQLREQHHKWSDQHEIHAEMNAILFAAKNGISIDGTILYTTLFPCQHCLKNILQCGIIAIVYKNEYDLAEKDNDFMKFIQSKIEIIKI